MYFCFVQNFHFFSDGAFVVAAAAAAGMNGRASGVLIAISVDVGGSGVVVYCFIGSVVMAARILIIIVLS